MKNGKNKKSYVKGNKGSKNCEFTNSRGRKKNDPIDSEVGQNTNDAAWYTVAPEINEAVARLPFGYMLGQGLPDFDESLTNVTRTDNGAIPGVMVYRLNPAVGAADTAFDAITMAARDKYVFIRHANSGSTNYESPDMMMAFIAIYSIHTWITTLKRLYGMAMITSNYNYYVPRTLIEASGFDYNDIIQNLPALRALINVSSARINKLKTPNMPIRDRWDYLSSKYFVDDDGVKPQISIPMFHNYYKWTPRTSTTGSSLVLTSPWSELSSIGEAVVPISFADIYAFTQNLIEALVEDMDIGIICGDVMKAYGDNVTTESMIDENYVSLPEYSPEAMMQLHNATIPTRHVGQTLMNAGYNSIGVGAIYQDENGVIKSSGYGNLLTVLPDFALNGRPLYSQYKIFDTYLDRPTADEVLVMSRLTTMIEQGSADQPIVWTYGSEIVCAVDIYAADSFWRFRGTELMYSTANTPGLTNPLDGRDLTYISKFKNYPVTRIWHSADLSGEGFDYNYFDCQGILGDLENYTVLKYDELKRIHNAAILALFGFK